MTDSDKNTLIGQSFVVMLIALVVVVLAGLSTTIAEESQLKNPEEVLNQADGYLIINSDGESEVVVPEADNVVEE